MEETQYTLYIEIDREHIQPERLDATRKTYQTYIDMWKQKQLKQYSVAGNYDAGFDLPMLKEHVFESYQDIGTIHLGVRAKMTCEKVENVNIVSSRFENARLTSIHPVCYFLYPRSSISKTPFRMANSVGIIDSGYRGPLKAVVDIKYKGEEPVEIEEGSRLFQICAPGLHRINDIQLVDSLDETIRGEGGFGSTGRLEYTND